MNKPDPIFVKLLEPMHKTVYNTENLVLVVDLFRVALLKGIDCSNELYSLVQTGFTTLGTDKEPEARFTTLCQALATLVVVGQQNS